MRQYLIIILIYIFDKQLLMKIFFIYLLSTSTSSLWKLALERQFWAEGTAEAETLWKEENGRKQAIQKFEWELELELRA